MAAAGPRHLLYDVRNKFQSGCDFLRRRWILLIIRYRQLMRVRPGVDLVKELRKCLNSILECQLFALFQIYQGWNLPIAVNHKNRAPLAEQGNLGWVGRTFWDKPFFHPVRYDL